MSNTALVAQSREVLAHHGRTFHLASHLLPASRRDDAAVVYAFCRHVDDLADEAPDADRALADLTSVREELAGEHPPRPWVGAFLEVAERRKIDLQTADLLIDAVLGDLGDVRIVDDDELRRYCYGVAGTVGLMMCGVLGVDDPAAHARAVDLGLGMQITNICRDVREDAVRGRVYLPAERLRAAGVDPDALLSGAWNEELHRGVAQVVGDLLDLADVYYESADAGMKAIPMPARAAILVASRVYREIGGRLRRRHASDPLHGRTVVPMARRVSLALRSLFQLLQPTFWNGVVVRPAHTLHGGITGLPGLEA